MVPQDLTTHPVTNLERFLVIRYRNAHEMLETDVDAAEQELPSLLDEPRLPIWIRAQCNMLLAAITEEYNEAMRYLRDARTFLRLFRERHNGVTPRILSMERDLAELKKTLRSVRKPGSDLEAIRHNPPHVQLLHPRHPGSVRRVNPGHHSERVRSLVMRRTMGCCSGPKRPPNTAVHLAHCRFTRGTWTSSRSRGKRIRAIECEAQRLRNEAAHLLRRGKRKSPDANNS